MSKGKRSGNKNKGKRKSKPAAASKGAADETVGAAGADDDERDDGAADDAPEAPEPEPEPEPKAAKPKAKLPRAEVSDPPPPTGLIAVLSRLDAALGVVELILVSLFLAVLVGTAVYQFVASKFLSLNDNWPFEVIRYSVFFTAMTAAALAAQQKKMMAIDFVPRLLSPKTRAISRVVIGLVVVFVCYLFIRGGLMVRDSIAKTTEHYDVVKPTTGALAMPLGAGLIGLHFLLHALIDSLYLFSGRLPPEETGVSVH